MKHEGLLNISTLRLGLWYKALLEKYVTAEVDDNGFQYDKRCKIEREHPDIDWDRTWSLACIRGLESSEYTFLWKMIHNLLPTKERLSRILATVTNPQCALCNSQDTCNLAHALFSCSFNNNVGQWLLNLLSSIIPNVTPSQVILLNLNIQDKQQLPVIWLIANVLSIVWNCRMDKKTVNLITTRATLEANIMLLRKTRFHSAATKIDKILNPE